MQLARGVTEAASARDQLTAAAESIAAGAQQSSSASLQSLSAMTQISSRVSRQSELAEDASTKCLTLQRVIEQVGRDVADLVTNVGVASERQTASVAMVDDLSAQATRINEAVTQVMRIADQTNLLALNAAIEAGRAGRHGKGFAVVADTVRTLAETSERNALDISQQIERILAQTASISQSVKRSADNASAEVAKGGVIATQLTQIRSDMSCVYDLSRSLSGAADEMNAAAGQTLQGAQSIAAAAEEQTAAVEQVIRTLEQQGVGLSGAEEASQGLEIIADELKTSADIGKSSEEVAAVAEELSAAIEEITRSASEIMGAISQISKGAEQASAAVEQAVAGITQIEKKTSDVHQSTSKAVELTEKMGELLAENRQMVESMVGGINEALQAGRSNLEQIHEVEKLVREVDKVAEAIGTVSIKIAMLAVNGAVEAARAGEYGKGFAVVSGDIQSLADDAAENVEQIKDLVKGIHDQAMRVRFDLDAVAQSSLEEVKKAHSSMAKLEEISVDAASILVGNQEINGAATEIVTAVSQATEGMVQIAAANEQAVSKTQEAAAAARQQARGAEELAAAIEDIASTADELQSA